MPVFEFVCINCHRRFRKLIGVSAHSTPPACPRCGSSALQKQISRFAKVRSEEDTLDSLANEIESMDESDTTSMRRMMRSLSSEMGEDIDEGELEEMIEEEQKGADPDMEMGAE